MRRKRWRLADLISGSTPVALRPACASQAQSAPDRRPGPRVAPFGSVAKVMFLCIVYIPPSPIYVNLGPVAGATARFHPGFPVHDRSDPVSFRELVGSSTGSASIGWYNAGHDSRRSNLRTSKTTDPGTIEVAWNVCKHLWFAAVSDQRQESFVIWVWRVTAARHGSGARVAPVEYSSNAKGKLGRLLRNCAGWEAAARRKWLERSAGGQAKKWGSCLGTRAPIGASPFVSVVFTPTRGVIHPSFPLRGRWERTLERGEQAPSPSLATLLDSSSETRQRWVILHDVRQPATKPLNS